MLFDLEKEFTRLGPEIETLRRLVAEALKLDLDPGVRAQVQELSQTMESSYAEAKRLAPAEAARMKQEVADLQSSIDKSQQEIAALEKQLAEAQAAAAAPPAPPPPLPALDPRHGRLLRDELLQRFGPPTTDAKTPLEGREVQEMVSGDFRPETPAPQPPTAPPPTGSQTQQAKEQKRPTPDKEAWELSSGAWDKDQ